MLVVLLPLAAALLVHAQSAENVAVVINESSDASVRIGEYYIRKRSIPSVNVIRIKAPGQEEVSREVSTAAIERPIAVTLTRTGLHDRILYLVRTKGVPFVSPGGPGSRG